MSKLISIEDRGAYALLQIQRPEKRNAMNSEARQALRAALRELNGSHRVVVLTGTESSFCSGLDLKEFALADNAAMRREEASREWIQTLLDIRRHPAIFVAAVNGLALGGGSSLINFCDLAVASETAEIGMPEMGFGTYPAMAGPSTQRMLSAKRAAWMVLTAKRITGRTAEQWGLVNECVSAERLEEHCDALARHIAQFDAVSLAESKQALDLIPYRISEWPAIMEHGQWVNAAIRARTDAQSKGLIHFASGMPKPDQDPPA